MYDLIQHKNLTPEKWQAYPKTQQVLMIANELNRAKNWIEKKETTHVNLCYERALELTDLTSEDKKWPPVPLRELRRFREVLASVYICPQKEVAANASLYRLLLQMVPGAWNMLKGK